MMSVRALFRKTPTIAPIPHRSLLSVTGSQASEFLNGIVASTVPSSPDCHFFTAFLHAQGRVLYDAFVYSHTNPDGKKGYILEYDSRTSEAPPLLSMLKRYVLRSKVRLRDVSEEYDAWAAWGSENESQWETTRRWNPARSAAIEPVWDSEENPCPWGTTPCILRDRRAVGMGHRLLVKKGSLPQESSTHEIAPSSAYTLHRILHGVPEGVIDIPPMQAFPMDSNLDIMGALDFRKGCYVGQELTVRTYHTGILRKRIFPVAIKPSGSPDAPLDTTSQFPPHLDIRGNISDTGKGEAQRVRPRGTGKLLTSTNGVGLALLRLQHVRAAEEGQVSLEFDLDGNDNGSRWQVAHWYPDWWPVLPAEVAQ